MRSPKNRNHFGRMTSTTEGEKEKRHHNDAHIKCNISSSSTLMQCINRPFETIENAACALTNFAKRHILHGIALSSLPIFNSSIADIQITPLSHSIWLLPICFEILSAIRSHPLSLSIFQCYCGLFISMEWNFRYCCCCTPSSRDA